MGDRNMLGLIAAKAGCCLLLPLALTGGLTAMFEWIAGRSTVLFVAVPLVMLAAAGWLLGRRRTLPRMDPEEGARPPHPASPPPSTASR